MNQTPTELLAPYKAQVIEPARAPLRASGGAGVAFDIPGSVPPSVIVIGEESEVGKLLRTPMGELLPGGRRAGDPPPASLSWDEPTPGAPRKWTILLSSENHGLVGALGSKHEHAAGHFERVDVVELEPVVGQLVAVMQENAQHLETVQQLRAEVAELQKRAPTASQPDEARDAALPPDVLERVRAILKADRCKRYEAWSGEGGGIYKADDGDWIDIDEAQAIMDDAIKLLSAAPTAASPFHPEPEKQQDNERRLTTLLEAAGARRLVRCHDGSGEPFEAYDKDIADRVVAKLRAENHALTDAPPHPVQQQEPSDAVLEAIEDAIRSECKIEWDADLGGNLVIGDVAVIYRAALAQKGQ